MGLIKAALGSIGGVMADQWKEYFYCEAIPENVWRGRTFRNAAEFPHAVPEKEEGALPAHAFRATYVVSSAVGAGRIRSVAHRQHAAARFLAHSAQDRGL